MTLSLFRPSSFFFFVILCLLASHFTLGMPTNRKRIQRSENEAEKYIITWTAVQRIVKSWTIITIEEGFKQKPRQRSSRLFGGQLLCRASYFALVVLKEMVQIILFFQNDRGKMACAARNLPPQTDATTFALASVQFLLLWLLHTLASV